MQLALRPFTTAGIALVGAGVIAVSPLAPPPVATSATTTVSTTSVALTASSTFVDPIARWAEVLSTSQTLAAPIFNAAAENPMPVLRQILANQTAYAESIGAALSMTANNLIVWATQEGFGRLPTVLNNIAAALPEGNILGALQEVTSGISGAATNLFGLVDLLAIPYKVSKNVTAVFYTIVPKGLVDTGLVGKTAYGILNVANVGITAVGRSVQAVIDSVKAGDATGAVSAAVNAPADVFDWVVNGGPPNKFGNRGPGLLYNREGAYFGPVAALVLRIPKAIAAAITPPTMATSTTDSPAIAAAPAPELPAADNADATPEALPEPDSEEAPVASTAVDSPEPGNRVEHTTAGRADASPLATDKVTTDTVESDTAVSRPAQRVRTSLHDAADQAGKRVKKLTSGIEKSVKKITDSFPKAGKKEAADSAGTPSAKKAKATSSSAASSDKKDKTGSDD
ncbi:hypothetical protein NLX62_04085 [Mycobacteriaceae bacterium Msp059]|nr:hypothetical protein [Mycobacteriaceae bacterium Msp059]